MSASNGNSWLRAQRKMDLVEVADAVGLQNYESYKKSELEAALDEYLAANESKFASNPKIAGYFNARQRSMGSPIKKEMTTVKDESEKALKVAKRKVSKTADEIINEADTSTASAVVRTPARNVSQVASSFPTTPADVANYAERSAVAVRQRFVSGYHETGISEVSQVTRETLSTVSSVLAVISLWELFCIRPEVMPSHYVFTIPHLALINMNDYPVWIPDVWCLLQSRFWSPVFAWALTSFVIPTIAGYFFNLSASHSQGPRTRAKAAAQADEYNVDPLTFAVAKAVVSFVVYGQGATLGGLLSPESIARLDGAVYGGYKGILAGTAITVLVRIYDAVLKK